MEMIDQHRFADRQRVLADFGDFVLDHDDLDTILNEACRLVAGALGVDLAKVIEIEPRGNTGLVRAGVGWRPGIVGHERVSLSERSSEAFAIEKTQPVITKDLAREERFVFPAFLLDHGVVALVNVPILLPGREPYGILQVDARQPRDFDQDDIEFLRTYAMVLGPVIGRLKTAAMLRNTDERLRLIVENARAYVMIASDADDRITDWLGGSEDILGWSASEAVGEPMDLIFTDEDRVAGVSEREVFRARASGTAGDERWHRRRDGTRVFIDGQTIALKGQDGALRGYFKIGRDSTDRKREEERQGFLFKLSDALRPLTTVAEITALAAAGLREQLGVNRVFYGEIADGSLRVEQDCPSGVSSIVGEHPMDVFGPGFLKRYTSGAIIQVENIADDPRLNEAARSGLRAREVAAFADHVLFDDERKVSLLAVQSATPRAWTQVEGNLIREVGERVKTAIERARAEAALRESEARLRQFGEASSDVLWIRDAETLQWDYLSPAFEMVYGVRLDQALAGDNLQNWEALILEEDREHALASIKRVRDGEQVTFEYRVRRPDGEIRWLRDTDFPIYGPDGTVERIGGIGQDATTLKHAQQRQDVLIAELQHRTRNLMAVVRSTADKTARASADLPDFRARFRDRLEALARVQGLLSRLNDLDRVTFDEVIRTELSAMDGGSDRITLEGPADVRLRSSTVQTLAMALHELATNAVKYGALGQPAAHLTVTWSLEPAGAGGKPWLHVDWRESGVTIPANGMVSRGTGQGRELIERALPYQLGAKTSYTLGPEGVHCAISVPVSGTTLEMQHG